MVRQRGNTSIYKVVSQDTKKNYYVELIRLKNNYYGNPRYEAHIISIECLEKYGYTGAWVYRFTGHYYGEQEACNFIVAYHEKKIQQTHN